MIYELSNLTNLLEEDLMEEPMVEIIQGLKYHTPGTRPPIKDLKS